MKSLGESIDTIKNGIIRNKTLVIFDIVGSIAALAIAFGERLLPDDTWVEDAIIVSAFIVVVLVIAMNVIQFVRKYRSWIAHAIVAQKYGYGYEKLRVQAYLEEHTKRMRVHRCVHLRATATQNSVRHYLHSLSNSLGSDIEIDGERKIKPPGIDIEVNKVPELSFKDRMVVEVTFHPPLDKGDNVEYELREIIPPGGFFTTADDLKAKGLAFEYLSWHVNKPTRALEYTVYIPKSLGPIEFKYDVWYGGYSQQRHKQEFRRTASFFEEDKTDPIYVAWRLKIPYPVIGLIYVIKWGYD